MNARRWAGPPTPPHGDPQAPRAPQAEWTGYAPPQAGPNYGGWPQHPPPGQRGQWPGYPPPKNKRRGLKIGGLVAGIAALLVIAGVSNGSAAPQAAPAPGLAPATAPPAPAGRPSLAPPTAPAPVPSHAPVLVGPTSSVGSKPTTATVARVVDGDTFTTTDGQTVRLLGIDSCEAGTSAGRHATSSAGAVLSGSTVTLTSEPGVDRDRYNRALRYVATSSGDFGRYMVVFDHTAVFGGQNDAAPSYTAGLRALDTDGRICGDVPPPQPVVPPTVTDNDNDHKRVPDVAVPDSSRSGSSSGSSSGGSGYENCSAARAAGAAPLHRGEPEYSPKLDRDGDGVACEPKPS